MRPGTHTAIVAGANHGIEVIAYLAPDAASLITANVITLR